MAVAADNLDVRIDYEVQPDAAELAPGENAAPEPELEAELDLEPEQPPDTGEQDRRRKVSWRNPFTSRMFRTILWSLIPPSLLLIVFVERVSLAYSQSWIVHSLVTLLTVLVIVGAVCATILRPLSELLRAQATRVDDDSGGLLVPDRYLRSDEIGDIIRNHNRFVHGVRDARERYKGLIEGLDAIVYEANATTQRFTYVSPQLESLLGYPPEMWVNDPAAWVRQLHPEDRAGVLDQWLDDSSRNNERCSEYRMISPDGRVVWLRDIARTVMRVDPHSGTPFKQLQGIMLDISATKEAEHDLRESEVKFRSLFENLHDAFALHEIVQDATGAPVDYRFLDVNSAFEMSTGLRRDDIIGRCVTEVLPGIADDPANWIQRYGAVAISGVPERFESYAEPFKRWYSIHVYSPSPGRFATLFEDVTERKRVETELRSKTQFLTSIMNAIPAHLFWKDVEGQYRGCNTQFALSAGLSSPETVIGKSDYDLGWDRDRAEFYRQGDQSILESGKPLRNSEGTLHEPDGDMIDLLTNKVPLLDSDGRPVGILGMCVDISELKERENGLTRRTNELRRRITGLRVACDKMSTILTAVQNGVVLVEADTQRIANINAVGARMIGRSHSHIVGRPVQEFVELHAEAISEWRERGGSEFSGELSLLAHDRQPVPIIMSITLIQLSGIDYLLESFIDISGRKAAERRLEERERYYYALLEDASDLVAVLSNDGVVENASPSLARCLGRHPDEMIGVDLQTFLDSVDVERYEHLKHQVLAARGGSISFQLRFHHIDASLRWLEGIIGVLPDSEAPPRMVLHARDVSAHRQIEVVSTIPATGPSWSHHSPSP